ncbi:MAG: divergent polysaccharide deacetylase family protein [Alphaproteobacteria bacterium]|nr:divergent polysaccharide deacetylase family protein [Alphaproteobacteria bacterium]
MAQKDHIQSQAKSPLVFRIVLTVVVLSALSLLFFLFKLNHEDNGLKSEKSVAVVVMGEEVKQEPLVKQIKEEEKEPIAEERVVSAPISGVLPIVDDVVYMIEQAGEIENDDDFLADDEFDQALDLALEAEASHEPEEDFEEIKEEEPEDDVAPENVQEGEEYFVSVVIDDMGVNQQRTKEMIEIKAPLTSSFLTYGKNLDEHCLAAQEAGHEIMMHTPMEPKVEADLAPDTLKISMSDEQIEDEFLKMLSKFEGANLKGINNHMGSRFTESAEKLDVVMRVLKDKGLFFLDSKTSQFTRGEEVASLEGVDYLQRDVFLDNEDNYDYVLGQLQKLERKAKKKGYAVGIGHPKKATIAALKDWVKTLDDKPVKLVFLSELLEIKKQKK